ncbi:MAG: ribbon-helix-helix domain-containing protein [Verrucomicrobiales bacterium]|nr:ribbon-helix-helix domain-containing protein [Verrucomicrobiales bacterium]
MASLTIYLDDETLKAVENAAREQGRSVSSWAGRLLFEAAKPLESWPEAYFDTIESFSESTIEEPDEIAVPLDVINLDSTS